MQALRKEEPKAKRRKTSSSPDYTGDASEVPTLPQLIALMNTRYVGQGRYLDDSGAILLFVWRLSTESTLRCTTSTVTFASSTRASTCCAAQSNSAILSTKQTILIANIPRWAPTRCAQSGAAGKLRALQRSNRRICELLTRSTSPSTTGVTDGRSSLRQQGHLLRPSRLRAQPTTARSGRLEQHLFNYIQPEKTASLGTSAALRPCRRVPLRPYSCPPVATTRSSPPSWLTTARLLPRRASG